jgi:hypothetical protein
MENEISSNKKLVLKNKFIKSFEDFVKEFNSLGDSQLKLIETIDLNRNYLNENSFSKILESKMLDCLKLKVINL